MAATSRGTAASLEDDLLNRAHEFSFFQAMHLLGVLLQDCGDAGRPGKVRVRPELSLAFPCSDVARIEKKEYGYLVTVTFLGLYGQTSPLPTFYTEQLLDESAAEMSATRDFLDIFHHRIYTLFYECAIKYRLIPRHMDLEEDSHLERFFCLLGLGEKSLRRGLPDPQALLRYTGLLTQHPRSALGLQSFMGDALQVPVQVVQCLERRVPVPADQRLQLGGANCTLGADAVVGCEVSDRNGMFRLQLGPLDRQIFAAYLPGTPGRCRLDALLRFYLTAPLEWDLELKHNPKEIPAAVLGSVAGGRLGWDSWLAPDETLTEPSVVFPRTFDRACC
jgi:type VI secretion system protein ImpH